MTLILSGTDGLSDVDGTAATPAIRGTDTNTGIFFPAADTIAFSEGGVESMRLDSSGNLAFTGTSQRITGDFSNATIANRVAFQTSTVNGNTTINAIPNGTATASQFITHNAVDPGNSSRAGFNTTSTLATFFSDIQGTGTFLPMTFNTGGSERMRLDTSGNVGIGTSSPASRLHIQGSTDCVLTNTAQSGSSWFAGTNTSAYILHNASNTPMLFTTNGAERARIDSSGNLLVGTTSNTSTLGMAVRAAFDTSASVVLGKNNGASNNTWIEFYLGGASRGQINFNGSGTTYTTSSDYRLKENIAPMTGALTKVSALKPCTYRWKETGNTGQGFIAHELQKVCPDAVTGEKDAVDAEGNPRYQGIDTSFLVATLTAAVQEQQAIIQSLTARIEALEGK